ncbi:MAG: hypothetical protein B6I36_02945 [Desulfobacteraceae bacterium 4572_35.1]|nr:MAG: hypothetical protein B6I36_02945 [Desulfobacteraceae bacterium 4572_35.1]
MKKHILYSLILLLIFLTASCGTTKPGEDEYNKGIEANKEDKIELAQQLFKQAIEKNPKLAEAHINLGQTYIKLHDFEQGWAETLKGLELATTTKTTIIRGSTWQEQAALANNNLAKIVFDRAIKACSSGNLAEQQRYKDEALIYMQQAVELAPENETIEKNFKYIQQWPN